MKDQFRYIGLPVIGLIMLFTFMAHMEAKAFNRLTGRDVTTWEAMFVSLRVDCEE